MKKWTEFMKDRIEGKEKNIPLFVVNKKKAYDYAQSLGIRVPSLFCEYKNASQLKESDIPDRCVIKPLGFHSTQGIMLLRRISPGIYFDSMKKKEVSFEDICNVQMELESRAKFIDSYRLLVEEWVRGEGQGVDDIPMDFKFYCYGDKISLISVFDRNVRPVSISWFFDENFENVNSEGKVGSDWKALQKGRIFVPDCYKNLVIAAKNLAENLDTPFVSVDLYASIDGPVFGELTLTPGGPYYGEMYKFSDKFDFYNGALWQSRKLELEINKGINFD